MNSPEYSLKVRNCRNWHTLLLLDFRLLIKNQVSDAIVVIAQNFAKHQKDPDCLLRLMHLMKNLK